MLTGGIRSNAAFCGIFAIYHVLVTIAFLYWRAPLAHLPSAPRFGGSTTKVATRLHSDFHRAASGGSLPASSNLSHLLQHTHERNRHRAKSGAALPAQLLADDQAQDGSQLHWQYTKFPATPEQLKCHQRFGYGLIDAWRKQINQICNPSSPGGTSVICYEHAQVHHRRTDTFCEATNIWVDFSKVHGQPYSEQPTSSNLYHTYSPGAFIGTCTKSAAWVEDAFILHEVDMMRSFVEQDAVLENHVVVKAPTYMLYRDPDVHNLFHGGCDAFNMFLVAEALRLPKEEVQVVAWDRNMRGPLWDLHSLVLGGGRPLRRAADYSGLVQFRRLVWHLPGAASPLLTDVQQGLPCVNSDLVRAFGAHVLAQAGLYNTAPPARPSALFIQRRASASRNTGRILGNEAELLRVVRSGTDMDVIAADLAALPFLRQLALVRRANILIGAHGAGLFQLLFMAEQGVVVELLPAYRRDRHWRNLAGLAGRAYAPLRSLAPVRCNGTADVFDVDAAEFGRVLDGAVRLARQYGAGLLECGLAGCGALRELPPAAFPCAA